MDMISPLRVSAFDNDKISYGFYGRKGGVSTGIYAALNVGIGSKDKPRAVQENRARVAADMDVPIEKLLTVYQVHGNHCEYMNAPVTMDDRPQADSIVTDVAGLALGILTADCAPVLLRGKKQQDASPIIGAAHAGWRGALNGILQATIQTMLEHGAALESIHAVIGPCIQKKSYEVSSEFYESFINQSDANDCFFSAGKRDGHPHFDLSGYCAATLADTGVQKVYLSGVDTYADEENYFSCRRASHHNQSDYGRGISVIKIL